MTIHTDAVKEGTFLQRYLQYMSGVESPVAYDFWCGLWLLSTTLGRTIRVERPQVPVFLNLYVVLCADAGTTRKSTAIRRATAVYDAAGLGEGIATVTLSVTPEKLTEQLALQTVERGSGSVSIMVSELVTFLGKEQYSIAMPGLLTDLYDCPSLRTIQRVGTGTNTIANCYVTFLSASTPSWLVRAINPDVIEGGFTSRCLFVVEERRKRLIAWPDAEQSYNVDLIADELVYLRNQAKRWADRGITLSSNARDRFVRWYEARGSSDASDPFTGSFEAREDHHILRLAGLLAANEDCWIIHTNHLNHAIKIIAEHKRTACDMFGVNKESARLTTGIDKLRAVLAQAGELGISQTELVFKTRYALKSRELDYALALMHEMEMVQKFEIATLGRKKLLWRGTNKLHARTLNELIRERMTNG